MAERELAILIRARDLGASKAVRGVTKELGRMGSIGATAASNLTKNLLRIGVAAGVALGSQVVFGIRALEELDTLMRQTEATIASTGSTAGMTAGEVRALAENLENVTTVDDKAVQAGENVLLLYTRIGKETFPGATKAAVDLAVALAQGDAANADVAASAKILGKALNDPARGLGLLRKAGIAFDKQQEDQVKAMVKSGDILGAQQLILAELEKRYGEAGRAAGEGFGADMRRLNDAVEEGQKALAVGLMPVLRRAAEWLATKLADPATLATIAEFGDELAAGFEAALDFAEQIDWQAVGQGLGMARDAAKTIAQTFLNLPPWVQTAIVSGWGLNKLTGGALGSLVGELGKGLIKGVLGLTAAVVNINAGVVRSGGGVPGPGGMPLGGGLGFWDTIKAGIILAVGAGTAEALSEQAAKPVLNQVLPIVGGPIPVSGVPDWMVGPGFSQLPEAVDEVADRTDAAARQAHSDAAALTHQQAIDASNANTGLSRIATTISTFASRPIQFTLNSKVLLDGRMVSEGTVDWRLNMGSDVPVPV